MRFAVYFIIATFAFALALENGFQSAIGLLAEQGGGSPSYYQDLLQFGGYLSLGIVNSIYASKA